MCLIRCVRNPFVFLLVLVLAVGVAWMPASGCSLADHGWELIWTHSIDLAAPLLPTAEFDLCRRSLPEGVPKTVWWLVPDPMLALPGLFLLSGGEALTSGTTWRVFPAAAGVAQERSPSPGEPPVLLRTDRSRIRFFLFRDRHATEPCWQIAILQEGRVRGLWSSASFPWVEEKQVRSWFQVIFHRWPWPRNVLTSSFAASFEQRHLLYESVDAVKALIGRGVLRLRASTLPEPLATPFPIESLTP